MLTLQVLNSDATLNNFSSRHVFQFVSGSDVIVVLRIYDPSKSIRYIPTLDAQFSITLTKSDGSVVEKTPTPLFADDRSIVSFSLTAEESEEVISQNLILEINENGLITKAILPNGLSKLTIGSCK